MLWRKCVYDDLWVVRMNLVVFGGFCGYFGPVCTKVVSSWWMWLYDGTNRLLFCQTVAKQDILGDKSMVWCWEVVDKVSFDVSFFFRELSPLFLTFSLFSRKFGTKERPGQVVGIACCRDSKALYFWIVLFRMRNFGQLWRFPRYLRFSSLRIIYFTE